MNHSRQVLPSAVIRAAAALVAVGVAAGSPPQASAQPAALEPFSLVHQWPERATDSSGVIQDPVALDVSLDGRVYVSDAGIGGVHVMLPSGQFVPPFGATGASDERLGSPGRLAIEQVSERVYVLDAGSDRVVVFDLDGGYISSWDGVPAASIAAAANGRVYVADSALNQIRVFDPQGVEQFAFGRHGTDDGEFSLISDVSISPSGLVLAVGDLDDLRVQLFDIRANGASWRRTYMLNHPKYGAAPSSSSPPYLRCRAGTVHALGGDDVWVGDGTGACRVTPEGHSFTIAGSAGSGTICKQTVLVPRLRPATGQYYAVAAYDPNVGPCFSTRRSKNTELPTTPAVVQYGDPELRKVTRINLSATSERDDAGLVGPIRLGVPQPGTVFVQDSSSYSRFFGTDGTPLARSAMRTRFSPGVKCRRQIEIAEGSNVPGEIFGYFRHEHLVKAGKEIDRPGT